MLSEVQSYAEDACRRHRSRWHQKLCWQSLQAAERSSQGFLTFGRLVQAAAAEKDNTDLQQAVTQQVEALKKAKADLQKAEKQQQER